MKQTMRMLANSRRPGTIVYHPPPDEIRCDDLAAACRLVVAPAHGRLTPGSGGCAHRQIESSNKLGQLAKAIVRQQSTVDQVHEKDVCALHDLHHAHVTGVLRSADRRRDSSSQCTSASQPCPAQRASAQGRTFSISLHPDEIQAPLRDNIPVVYAYLWGRLGQWFAVYGKPERSAVVEGWLTEFSPSTKVYGSTKHYKGFRTQSKTMKKGRITR